MFLYFLSFGGGSVGWSVEVSGDVHAHARQTVLKDSVMISDQWCKPNGFFFMYVSSGSTCSNPCVIFSRGQTLDSLVSPPGHMTLMMYY